ncbi:MAG: excinuclease ABC subunit UvrA, partial [Myxococcales bacterium]
TDSVETALKEGKGMLAISDEKASKEADRVFSEQNACFRCGLSFGELSPPNFSFNNPLGMCGDCTGLGTRMEMDPELIVPDTSKTLRDGAIEPLGGGAAKWEGMTDEFLTELCRRFKIDLDTPWKDLSKKERDLLLHGTGQKEKNSHWYGDVKNFEGVANWLMRRFKTTESEGLRKYFMRYFSDKPCDSCGGARLKAESRAVRVHGKSIVDVSRYTIDEAWQFLEGLKLTETETKIATELLKEIRGRLGFLRNVGLGYLSLDRTASTLSGGESQRIRLASQIGSELTGVIYVLDEPSIGLHQRDNGKLLATLKRLRDVGNSVIVVEHDEETIEESDYLIDFGPGAGELGGRVVAHGTPKQVMADEKSLTGAYLSGRMEIAVPEKRREPGKAKIVVQGACENNLRNVDAEFPLGVFVAVTGVSGAGKSTLVNEILYPALMKSLHNSRENPGKHKAIKGLEHLDKVIAIDQRPIGRTPRSNPATYTKVFDHIREVFAQSPEARAFGYTPGRFSFNVKGGRCEACEGDGVKLVEMHFLPDVYVVCEACHGKRFNEATLRVKFKGKDISEVLDMSVREALEHFAFHKEIVRVLNTLNDVGLSYIKLGQSSTTLSGGEAQRIKLSRELCRTATGRTLYLLDEPTTGLHFEDIRKLLAVLNRLVDAGNTVIVIEHNLDVIKCADHLIDVGPEGGRGGGEIIATGTPEDVAKVERSWTGQYLKKVLKAHKARRPRADPTQPSASA